MWKALRHAIVGGLLVWLTLLAAPSGHAVSLPAAAASCTPQWVRPVPADANNRPARFYPYGSTGQGRYQVHHGVEFENPLGTPVLAVASGTIVVAGTDRQILWGRHFDYYGQLVVLETGERCNGRPVYALYGHLATIQVHVGEHVEQGQVLGRIGMSGVAMGPHLHFEVRVGANTFEHTRNPELWFAPLPGHGLLIGRVAQGRNLLGEVLITVHPAGQPNRYGREAWTYAAMYPERLNSDDRWGENWVINDVPAGEYLVRIRVNNKVYTQQVKVVAGETTWVELTL